MTDTTRGRVEKLAAERYPSPEDGLRRAMNRRGISVESIAMHNRMGFIEGFLAAKAEPVTVSAEKVEEAAHLHDTYGLTRSDAVDLITDALRAFGARREGEG